MIRRLCLVLICLCSLPLQAAISPFVAAKLQKAYELYEQDQSQQAIELLESLTPSSADASAYVGRMLAGLYSAAQRYPEAIAQMQRALDSGGLDPLSERQTQHELAQLLLSQERFDEAIVHYRALIASRSEVDEDARIAQWHLGLARAQARLAQWPQVQTAAAQALALLGDDEASRNPVLVARQLSLTAQWNLKQWAAAEQTLEALLALQPTRLAWWRQSISAQLQQNRVEAALVTSALAQRSGVLKSDADHLTLVQLFASQGLPELAARHLQHYLEQGLIATSAEQLQQLARYWQSAREWQLAIEAWETAAAQRPALLWPQIQLLMQQRQHRRALVVLDQALLVESLADRRGELYLAQVNAHYQLKQYHRAREAAVNATEHGQSQRGESWLTFLNGKLGQVSG
ncbi:lipopolysaccharide assembly protein LapB [Ferrimonas sp. SCSIO 43195]|uniref:tetratricopeptide repeat protein n=1 Tax=Ferrimonas sp. SCSIO 43195 TaxID=2822844 RepID=UPI002075F979|nr:tetratricopeptide repeat protein [Ferrimonas sp. SCSIO 43195]USD38837.1 tetratricopeptide repeat protein [Ferrimonas sp. SCSIO 43195]